MKVGILTHYQVESHGACLQHYALTQYLREKGHDVYTLSYHKNMDFADSASQKKFSVGISSVPYYLKEYLIKYGPSFFLVMAKKHQLLGEFNKKNFKYLPYGTADVDAAIVGADEVWSLQLGANMMMYGHGVDAKKMIAYAPSFGQTNIEEIKKHHCLPLISSGLASFASLSARDEGSVRIAEELTGRDVELVCDPVLLYGFEKELAQYRPMTSEKYVVVYGYNSNMNEPERAAAIKAYAKKIGAKVYSVGAFHKWCDKQVPCDPIELIYWCKGAEAVFTDTFHGTISAFLGQTPMAVYVRSTNNVKLDHLLQILGIEDRKVSEDSKTEEVISRSTDFEKLIKGFEPTRLASEKYLERALG
jgi:hypothetical protein